jgi:hypothetical protein
MFAKDAIGYPSSLAALPKLGRNILHGRNMLAYSSEFWRQKSFQKLTIGDRRIHPNRWGHPHHLEVS